MAQKINFKLRLVRKPKTPKGLYEQLEAGTAVVYDTSKFSLDEMKKAFAEMYSQKPAQRQVKIVTNQAGLDLFNKALQQEIKKQKHDRKGSRK